MLDSLIPWSAFHHMPKPVFAQSEIFRWLRGAQVRTLHLRTLVPQFLTEPRLLWRCGDRTCVTCVDTRWLAHVLRDRPDDSHGEGGLLQVGGPVADALWLQGFRVALLTLCLFVGGKQQKETKITIRTSKKDEHAPLRQFGSCAAVSS